MDANLLFANEADLLGPEKRWSEAHLDLVRSLFDARAAVKRQAFAEIAE
jgi:hypothetical protein